MNYRLRDDQYYLAQLATGRMRWGDLPRDVADRLEAAGELTTATPVLPVNDGHGAWLAPGPEPPTPSDGRLVPQQPAGSNGRGAQVAPLAQPPAWPVFTLADAYKPRPPSAYLIEGLLQTPSLSALYGAPGSFKTMLAMDLALCVAGGQPWLPPLPDRADVAPRPTMQSAVLWADFDNGADSVHERVAALARARNLQPETTPFCYVTMPTPWLDAGRPDTVAELVHRVRECGAKLVVIDNLGTVSGKADENSAEMVQVLGTFRRVAESTGAALVLIHHQRKTTAARGRPGESLRGHSSIEAALDLALLVTRDERSSTCVLRSTKTRRADVPPFGAVFTYQHKPGTTDLETARFFGIPTEDHGEPAVMQTVVAMVKTQPGIKKGNLVAAVLTQHPNAGRDRVASLIESMTGGRLKAETGGHNAKCYFPS